MVDLYKGMTIDERADVWVIYNLSQTIELGVVNWIQALGVLLYKLAFYTTPFEDDGALAIVNAKYVIPSDSPYSKAIHDLIAFMLVPDVDSRPEVFDVLERLSKLLHKDYEALKVLYEVSAFITPQSASSQTHCEISQTNRVSQNILTNSFTNEN
jgi:AP2-associated kinase